MISLSCVNMLTFAKLDYPTKGKPMKDRLRNLLFVILATCVCLAPNSFQFPSATAQQPANTVTIPGLHARVTIRRDERGIPYIEAANDDDLYFAQGYVTAS